ncbi:baseplate J/gp47 family protein [Serratia marcescens]|uniref:baseplate J/gp47 family protein n=1 Tax=Serratia marcescens TaxID=615 RepID=UPI0013DB58B2|nr:baseplate J/gp47 family protein [Serratia marcescens]
MADSNFSRPTLPQLIANIRSDLLTRFEDDVLLRRLDAEVYARVQAAAVHTVYGYIDYLARNMLPDLADAEWLVRHGAIKRCPRKSETPASGHVRWEGVPDDVEIATGTKVLRDDQQSYTVTATTKSGGGLLRAPVLADVAGGIGNADDGVIIRLEAPITNLPSAGYADSISGGEDVEPLETWRARIMERWFYTPQGGADHDYVIWAKEVPGVSRAWTFRHYRGVGTVGVMLATGDPSHPAPSPQVVEAARQHILPLAPIAGSSLYPFAASEKVIPMTIALAKDEPEIRKAVIAEINSFLLRDGVPSGTLHPSRISEAISIAAGEYAHRLESPTEIIVLGDTELPVLGEITWASY